MAENLDHTTPPQSIEAEQAVLGAILLDSDVFISVLEYVSADDFYSRANQLIFEAMEELNRDDEAIDALTVQQKLNNMHMLENVGGYEYIFQLANDTPTAANAEYYARIVEEKSLLRKLIQASNKIARESFEQEESVSVILDEAEKSILNVAENRNRNGFIHIRDVVFESMQNLDDLSKNGQDVTGIPTGYPDLDAMTAGLQPEELIILAARPAVGKTAFALNIAQNVATKQDGVVAVFSLEMGAGSLVNRMICAEGSINAGHLRTGQLTEDEWSDLIVASGALSEADIYIDDTPGIRVTEIRSKSRRLLKERGRLDLIVIDYLQLIEGSGK